MSTPTQDGVFLWQNEAKCGGQETKQFFDDEKAAKRFCKGCPVIGECLETALVYDYDGVWGGTTARERRRFSLKKSAVYLREDYKESGMYNPALKA
jgi:hypothetical protein